MSQEDRPNELADKTRELLHGSLKHVRAAALAAALIPLASVAASKPVVEQCPSGVCPPPPAFTVPSPCDFITSGGFVFADPPTAKATFGAHGGCKHGAFWGHVNYVDHGGAHPYHVNSTEITGYLINPDFPNARDICGWARTNDNEVVRFRVRLEDNGEPGILDTFGIRLSNGYLVTRRPLGDGGPGGGNVQLHGANPSSTAPSPEPTEEEMCGDLLTP